MPKIVAWTVLHYGREYLGYAARSVLDYVDEWHVAYTAIGSHGHRSDVTCPETRDELYAIASDAGGAKLHWHEGEWPYEGAHREAIHTYAPDADVILVLDADEIYADGLAQEAIEFALQGSVHLTRLPFLHLWRSFRKGFAHDPAYPVRVINPHVAMGETTLSTTRRVWHFGYCQSETIVAYKLTCHGHKNGFRKDVDWLNEVFLPNRQYDCHPVGSDAWNCEDIDLTDMPSVLHTHPFRNLEIVR